MGGNFGKIVENTAKPFAWDDTTTANVLYLKYSDRVVKIDKSAKTRTQCIGGVWADRATLDYTESGV